MQKQNGALATVKESQDAEETESKPEASAENKTGGNRMYVSVKRLLQYIC